MGISIDVSCMVLEEPADCKTRNGQPIWLQWSLKDCCGALQGHSFFNSDGFARYAIFPGNTDRMDCIILHVHYRTTLVASASVLVTLPITLATALTIQCSLNSLARLT
jgi:hypothetical protein